MGFSAAIESLLLIACIVALAKSAPGPVHMPLSQLSNDYASKEDMERVNVATYEDYGVPPVFFPAIIPDFYYDNESYTEGIEEKGCTWVNNCPNVQSDQYAPLHGIEDYAADESAEIYRKWKCHVETNCIALDEIPKDIENNTEILFLRYFNASVLHGDDLSILPPLIKLHIGLGSLKTLKPGVFKHQTGLEYLELVGNPIESLQPLTFQELAKLQSLEITDNSLSVLEKSTFKGLGSLTSLKLDGNRLASLADDVFGEMPQLQELHLDDNNLTSLSRYVFRGLSKLTTLYLGQNFFPKVPNMALRIAPSLEVLHLTGNPLKRISRTDFRHLDAIREIRLDRCGIEAVSRKAFRGKNISYLDLSENKLTRLGNLGSVGNKLSIQMAFNPWVCNCSLTATTNWITNYTVSLVPPQPRCHAPFHMSRRRISDLTNNHLCDPNATPPPIKPDEELPWLNFPNESEGDDPLPEGSWSEFGKPYDVDKLYPEIQHITVTPQSSTYEVINGMTESNEAISAGDIKTKKTPIVNGSNPFYKGQTTRFVSTSIYDESSTTTVVRVRILTDHVKMIIMIVGITIPVLSIIVLAIMIQATLRIRANSEKADIEMPHIDSKTCDAAEAKVNPCETETTDGQIHSKSPIDRSDETQLPRKQDIEDTTSDHSMLTRTQNDKISDVEHIEKTDADETNENIETHIKSKNS